MNEVKPDVVGAQEKVTGDALAAQSNAVSGADSMSKAMKDYFDNGQAKKDRMIMATKCAIWLSLLIAVIVAVLLFLPEMMDTAMIVGERMEEEKDNIGLIVLYLFLVVMFVATPFPGRGVFNLLLGYVYHWTALPILFFGHVVGGFIAFTLARLCWPYLASRWKVGQFCCCCCQRANGQPSKTVLFVLASLAAVEEKPFQSVFLLVLSPIPLTVMSYILGAKCDSLKLVTYLTAMALGGIKVIVPVYLGSKVHDLSKLIQAGADRDPVEMVVTSLSCFIGVAIFTFITRRAYINLQQAQEKLKNVASGEDLDRSDTNTIVTLELCKEYARSQAGENLAPGTPSRGIIICSFVCLALGVLCFIFALATLVRLTPIFEKMRLHIGERTMCPQVRVEFPWLILPSANFTFPVTVTNPNPVRIEINLEGSVYEAISGELIGHIVPSSIEVGAREKSLFGSGSPEEVLFAVDSVITNITRTNVPERTDLRPFLGSEPGTSDGSPGSGTDSPCSLPAEGDDDGRTQYLICMRSSCTDSDLAALTGSDFSCSVLVNFLGCDADLSEQRDNLPQGTYLRLLCANSCNNCGRLLQANSSPLPVVETSVIVELRMTGNANVVFFGDIEIKRAVSTIRYIRRTMQVPIQQRIRDQVDALMGTGNVQLRSGNLPVQCTTQADDFSSALCSYDKAALLGSDVRLGGAVTACGYIEMRDDESLERMEDRKWIGLIFIILVACCCMGGSCYCCALQGQIAFMAHSRHQKATQEVGDTLQSSEDQGESMEDETTL